MGLVSWLAVTFCAAAASKTNETVIKRSAPRSRHELRLVTTGTSSVVAPAVRSARYQAEAVSLRNMAKGAARLRFSSAATPDLSSFDRILKHIRSSATDNTTDALAMAAWKVVRDYRYSYQAATASDECHDPVKLFNVYGYGLCDDSARVLATLWSGLGLPVSLWEMKWHCISEYGDGETSHMLDADLQMYAPRPADGRPASVREIQRNPEWLKYAPESPLSLSILHVVRRTYKSRAKEAFICKRSNIVGHEIVHELRPGEKVTRFRQSQLGYFSTIDPNPPREMANAVYDWRPDVASEYWTKLLDAQTTSSCAESADGALSCEFQTSMVTRLPFVLTGGHVDVTFNAGSAENVGISFSRDGKELVPATMRRSILDADGTRTLTVEVPPRIRGAYDLGIFIHSRTTTARPVVIHSYKQTLVTQCSTSTFPKLALGEETELTVESDRSGPVEIVYTLIEQPAVTDRSSSRRK